jgi:hypothetical protein
MAGKQGGLGANLYIGGVNVSGDIGALQNLSTPQTVEADTGIDKFAMERIAVKKDGDIAVQTWWNSTGIHLVLSTLLTTDQLYSYWQYPLAVGGECFSMIGKQINYDPVRADSGMLTTTFHAQANGFGAEWGLSLTAGVRIDTAATNGASIDGGAASNFGGQAYCHVFGVTGTSMTVKIQDSADNVAFADVTGLTFSTVNAGSILGQRLATANNATIRRYVRAVSTGTFNPGSFAVQFVRNPIAGVGF